MEVSLPHLEVVEMGKFTLKLKEFSFQHDGGGGGGDYGRFYCLTTFLEGGGN